MYNEVLKLIPLIKQYADNYELHGKKENVEFLSKLTLEELWIAHTIERIGATARGIRVHQDFSEQGRSKSFFKTHISSSKDLLDVYSKYTKFYESKNFIHLLSYSSLIPSNIEAGIGLITELSENNKQYDYSWPLPGKRIEYSDSEVELVRTDDYTENFIFFVFRKDVAFKIKELQLEFDHWLTSVKEVHPFHRFYEEWTRDGELYYKGYVNEYSRQDFIDWLNTEKYCCFVAYEINKPTHVRQFLHLDF